MNRILAEAPAGTVVSVGRGAYRHVGLLTEGWIDGERAVLSLNPGELSAQLREEPLSSFCRGERPRVETLTGQLPPSAVLARARSRMHPPYSWTAFNCEHFVRFAHGLALKSPQLAVWTLVAGVATLLFSLKTASA